MTKKISNIGEFRNVDSPDVIDISEYDKYNNMSPEELVDTLDKMTRSKGYTIIRDYIDKKTVENIKSHDIKLYQLFQAIKMECKESWDYDRKVPTMADVNIGLTNLYGVILKIMRANIDDNQDKFIKIQTAINRIEEKVGLESTQWNRS